MKLPEKFVTEITSNPFGAPSPRSILVTLGDLIATQTSQHVKGIVEYQKTTFDGLVVGHGIQRFIYDFVLSAPALGYRYYLFQIQYEADPDHYYPVRLTIDQDIAEELNCSVEMTCTDAENLEAQLEHIMEAPKTIAIVRSLYHHSQAEQSEDMPGVQA